MGKVKGWLQRWAWHAGMWVLVIIVLVCGWNLDRTHPSMNWISRSGCVVVALGIFSGFLAILRQELLSRSIAVRRVFAIRKVRTHFRTEPEEMEKAVAEIEQRFRDFLDEGKISIQYELGVAEFSMLILGTLLWGFGDLL